MRISNTPLIKPLRTGIDCRLWNETGVGRYIRNLVLELQKIDTTNHYVLFVTPKDVSQVKSSIINNKWSIVVVDLRWHSIKEQLLFPKILEKAKLDLVHFPYFSVPIFYNKPYVVTIHDIIIHHFSTGKASTLPAPLYFAKWKGYEFVLSYALKHAMRVIAVSNTVSSQLQKEFGVPKEKIAVTYEGVDAIIKKQATNYQLPATSYFLYVGNVYPHKNVERLIEAFRRILGDKDIRILGENQKSSSEETAPNIAISQYRNLKLVIVGKEDYFVKRLQQKVTYKPYVNSILFLHSVSDTELASLYQYAIALVTPSLMEGFGLPALEAMANNCRVIASKIPVYEEILSDKAILFDPTNTKSLIQAMEKAMNETGEEKAAKLQSAKKHAGIFSWHKMAEETLHVYKNSL